MERTFVYILANDRGNVLYVGITKNLKSRMAQHKSRKIMGFTQKYNAHRLMYYEEFPERKIALLHESQIKRLTRRKKQALVNLQNPAWKDLHEGINVTL